MIEFSCSSCSKKYRVKDELAGKTARCKDCSAAMLIPGGAADVSGGTARSTPSSTPGARPTTRPATHGEQPIRSRQQQQPTRAPQRRTMSESGVDTASSEVLTGSTPHFDFEISQRPDFALVTIHLEEGQKVFAEPSAMASMSTTVTLKAGFKGGLGKTLGRAFGGESLIINTFTADRGSGEVTFAPGTTGDVTHYTLTGNTLMLQRGAFMLHSDGVEVTGKWQGAKGFFSGEGLVLLKASGDGEIFFNSYGAILSVDVMDEYIVDTGYIVAFEDTLRYNISVLPGLRGGSSLKSLFFGGEGLVCRFSGQGRVWIQTRHAQSFLSWVNAFRPTKSK